MRVVRILKAYTGKAHPPWVVSDADTKEFMFSRPSMSEALYEVEQQGWIIKSDMPAVLGPDLMTSKYEKKSKSIPKWMNRYSYE